MTKESMTDRRMESAVKLNAWIERLADIEHDHIEAYGYKGYHSLNIGLSDFINLSHFLTELLSNLESSPSSQEVVVIAHLFENTIEGFTSECDCLRSVKRDDIAHALIPVAELDYPPADEGYFTIATILSASGATA